jgi:hypothetical protein
MFSITTYIKHPGVEINEERTDSGEYTGTYQVVVPCSICLDQSLKNEVAVKVFTYTKLSLAEIAPEAIYMRIMGEFESPIHIN